MPPDTDDDRPDKGTRTATSTRQPILPANQEGPATPVNNVNALVAKSKKAACTLWTLLHAKTCRLGTQHCSQSGCAEAKILFLHMKTCPSKGWEPCPTGVKGCLDSRKLLAHYSRCRDIRARQVSSTTRPKTPRHLCLVCSLVARKAKGSLDRSTTCISSSRVTSPYRADKNRSTLTFSVINDQLQHIKPKSMSPPPPRFPFSKQKKEAADIQSAVYSALQTSLLPVNEDGKQQTLVCTSIPEGTIPTARPRAESLDLRRSSVCTLKDPTDPLEEEDEDHAPPARKPRRRSLSCSAPTSRSQKIGSFDPNFEDQVDGDLQDILEGDS